MPVSHLFLLLIGSKFLEKSSYFVMSAPFQTFFVGRRGKSSNLVVLLKPARSRLRLRDREYELRDLRSIGAAWNRGLGLDGRSCFVFFRCCLRLASSLLTCASNDGEWLDESPLEELRLVLE